MPRGGGGRRSSSGGRSGGFFSRGGSSSPGRSSWFGQAPSRGPATSHQAPPRSGGMFGGIGSTLATGLAFGAGSEVAHQAVRGMTGGGYGSQPGYAQQQQPVEYGGQQYDQQQQYQQPKCQIESDQFIQCLKNNGDSISACQGIFEQLKTCEQQK